MPAGVCLTNWKRVGGWLARELNRRQTSPDHERLQSLGTLLDSSALDLIRLDASIEPAPACDAVALERPPKPTPIAEIVSDCDLNRVRRACRALYGTPGRNEHVSKADCAADAARVIADFERAKIEPSARLRDQQAGGPMTNRRVLSVLYSGEGLTDAAPKTWTVLRDRVLERGGDRAVLLAMLAWARGNPNDPMAANIERTVPLLWARAPDWTPAVAELHEALAAARRE